MMSPFLLCDVRPCQAVLLIKSLFNFSFLIVFFSLFPSLFPASFLFSSVT